MTDGVSQESVCALSAEVPALAQAFIDLQGLGLVEKTETRYIPTKLGWLLGNELYGRIWASGG